MIDHEHEVGASNWNHKAWRTRWRSGGNPARSEPMHAFDVLVHLHEETYLLPAAREIADLTMVAAMNSLRKCTRSHRVIIDLQFLIYPGDEMARGVGVTSKPGIFGISVPPIHD